MGREVERGIALSANINAGISTPLIDPTPGKLCSLSFDHPLLFRRQLAISFHIYSFQLKAGK
jgi:hypothetical protein